MTILPRRTGILGLGRKHRPVVDHLGRPVHVAAWIEAGARQLSAPSVKQRLAALRHLFDWVWSRARSCRSTRANAGVPLTEILHSGQSQFTDMVGGKPLGLTIAWVNRRGIALDDKVPRPDHIFPDIVSLVHLLESAG